MVRMKTVTTTVEVQIPETTLAEWRVESTGGRVMRLMEERL